ncbi:hypothetical protein ABZT47_33365 [Sphaerisporangium sp. NPDC005289]|uniref:hypothetical protein n=1 Tax=Sphaerisporangium sp. NPDC005289 TaxID=3155247 RepID=UPI0033A33E83
MKLVIKVAALFFALLLAAGVAGASVAVAAPLPPKDPYPAVKIDPAICKVEALRVKKAQIRRDFAAKRYDRAEEALNKGVGSRDDFRKAETELAKRDIELTDAKYAEASCQLNKGARPKQSCEAMALELNRLLDQLANRKKLEAAAKEAYEKAKTAPGGFGVEQLESLDEAARIAEVERQETEQGIQDQRDLIKADPACKDFPSERPEVLPPPREVPPGTPTPAPTTQPTTTADPAIPAPTTTAVPTPTLDTGDALTR